MDNLAPISKAVAGGIVTALVAELAHYGLSLAPIYTDAIGVLVTGVVAYVIGHAVVYFAPSNKPKL